MERLEAVGGIASIATMRSKGNREIVLEFMED